ncbi:MAG: hypothetical protein KAR19_18980 [Bacteroidales bacterium]|nr:hypothetical protein [Bacteroidales bacterium]
MKIFILTMDDPVYTLPFIKYILENKRDDIVGLATSRGNRLTIKKKKSKVVYLLSLLLIMGLPFFLRNSLLTLIFKTEKILAKFNLANDPSIIFYARKLGIESQEIKSPNSKTFLNYLKKLNPDIIINQSQSILKRELLDTPNIGTLNRHNALLPKNRGRLTPFWVLFKEESKTGVSIHFVDETIDSGEIILQQSYSVTDKDTFRTLVNRNYEIAPKLMVKAIDLLAKGYSDFLPNDDSLSTYNSTPTFIEAWNYRKNRVKRCFYHR